MTDSKIKAFLMAAEHRSFTKAAKLLYITQPALSKQISALETELGFKLFIRDRNLIKLTESGEILYEGFMKIEADKEAVIRRAKEASGNNKGHLHIGIVEGQYLHQMYNETLMDMWSEQPNMEVKISYFPMSQQVSALMDDEVDVMIALSDNISGNRLLSYEPMITEQAWLAIPERFMKRYYANPSLSEFRDEVFLVLSENECKYVADMQNISFANAGFTPRTRVVPTLATLFNWLEAGMGIATLAGNPTIRNNPRISLVHVPELSSFTESIIWKKDTDNALISKFVDKAKERAQNR